MVPQILLNDKRWEVTSADLPMIIHGQVQTGASYLSLIILIHLIHRGERVLFFSTFDRGTEALLALLPQEKDIGYLQRPDDIEKKKRKVLIIKGGSETLLYSASHIFRQKRIIFIKNIERCSERILEVIQKSDQCIVSGDIERCLFKKQLLTEQFHTKIFFSDVAFLHMRLPLLDTYNGIFLGKKTRGIIRVTPSV